jgi:ElaB/YqjD/DUF883 family membrane-anchored ribosome-binding protein
MNPTNPDTLNPTARRTSSSDSIINKEVLEERVQEARDLARSTYERSKDKAMEWEESFEGYVKERPIKSLLVALGVGIIVGAVIARR